MMTVGPIWLAHFLAIVMLITASYCVGRMLYARARRRRTNHAVDSAHAAMGVAMAGMLVPSLGTFSMPVWVAVFSVGTLWFAWTTMRHHTAQSPTTSGHIGHVLGCAAMVYMFVAMPAADSVPGTAGMPVADVSVPGSERLPAVALIFGFGLLCYACWMAVCLSGLSESVATTGTPGTSVVYSRMYGAGFVSPRLAACCDVVVGLVMAYPLIGLA